MRVRKGDILQRVRNPTDRFPKGFKTEVRGACAEGLQFEITDAWGNVRWDMANGPWGEGVQDWAYANPRGPTTRTASP